MFMQNLSHELASFILLFQVSVSLALVRFNALDLTSTQCVILTIRTIVFVKPTMLKNLQFARVST